jgi:hypothetical protein
MNINQNKLDIKIKINSTPKHNMSITLKECNKFKKELKEKQYLAVVTSVQATWIENLINAEGDLNDIEEVYPEVTTNEIAQIVYDGVKANRIDAKMGNNFLSEAFFDMPPVSQGDSMVLTPQGDTMVHITVPHASRDIPQTYHNPNIRIEPEYPLEYSWTQWIIPLALTGIVLVTIGGIVYYIWKKKRKTPPTDSEDASSKGSSIPSSNKVSSSTSDTSKYSLDIVLKMFPLAYLLYWVGFYITQVWY